MKYAVTTTFYDNGSTKISEPFACADNTEDTTIQEWNRDIYIDVFDSYSDAVEFYLNNKEA